MACPDFQAYLLPILRVAASGEELNRQQLRDGAARLLGLSEADLDETVESGRQTKHRSRGGWAATYLRQAGLLEIVRRGVYRITERGRALLAENPERVDVEYLSRFPEFAAWSRGAAMNSGEAPASPAVTDALATASTTPVELIERGYNALRHGVESELLSRILAGTPAFFEAVVVELLVKMGYGGSMVDAGSAIGRSGDDGLDGIIKEDRLGLDAIYVQAKRWRPERKVGRPGVQAFAGSLEGVRARKGVFLTTSSFSPEAHDYVARIEKKIVLVDGPRLAGLMFDFSVGVRTKETYEVKEVDEEYFVED